jgi:hypothetical protein
MTCERDGAGRIACAVWPVLALIVALSACASTEITSSWKAPSARPIERGQKVLAVVVAPDKKARATAEDRLARRLADGKAAHLVFSDEQLEDRTALRERLAQEGYAYAVVMRLVGVKTETRNVVTQPAQNSTNMWGDSEALVWEDAQESFRTVRVVTRVYSVSSGELLWQAESSTINPDDVHQLVDEIADAAAERLEKDGMIAKK